jgi:hypothetical protein
MDRPYDLSEAGLIHLDAYNCQGAEEATGDASRDGVVRGLVEHGEGLCPECIDLETRQDLLKEAGEYLL